MNAKYKRRLIPIIDRHFQFKYTGLIMGVAALVSVVLGYFLLDAYRVNTALMGINEEVAAAVDDSEGQRVFFMVIGFLAAEVIFLGILGLLITHKVSGPMFVLTRNVQSLLDGKYPKTRPLRQGDEFKPTFDAFNEALSRMKSRDEADVVTLEKVIEAGQEAGLTDEHLDELKRLVQEARDRCS